MQMHLLTALSFFYLQLQFKSKSQKKLRLRVGLSPLWSVPLQPQIFPEFYFLISSPDLPILHEAVLEYGDSALLRKKTRRQNVSVRRTPTKKLWTMTQRATFWKRRCGRPSSFWRRTQFWTHWSLAMLVLVLQPNLHFFIKISQ